MVSPTERTNYLYFRWTSFICDQVAFTFFKECIPECHVYGSIKIHNHFTFHTHASKTNFMLAGSHYPPCFSGDTARNTNLLWPRSTSLAMHTKNDSINFIIHFFLDILHFQESCNLTGQQHFDPQLEKHFARYGIGGEIRVTVLVFILDYFLEKLMANFFKKSKAPQFRAILIPFYPNLG